MSFLFDIFSYSNKRDVCMISFDKSIVALNLSDADANVVSTVRHFEFQKVAKKIETKTSSKILCMFALFSNF